MARIAPGAGAARQAGPPGADRDRARLPRRCLTGLLALLVAVPGAVTYLGGALGSGHLREADQRVLAAHLPAGATVYGTYSPTLLFDTKVRVLTPWPPADANVDQPVRRFGVTDVLLGGRADPTGEVADVRDRRSMTLLARVPWNGEQLSLYRVSGR